MESNPYLKPLLVAGADTLTIIPSRTSAGHKRTLRLHDDPAKAAELAEGKDK